MIVEAAMTVGVEMTEAETIEGVMTEIGTIEEAAMIEIGTTEAVMTVEAAMSAAARGHVTAVADKGTGFCLAIFLFLLQISACSALRTRNGYEIYLEP